MDEHPATKLPIKRSGFVVLIQSSNFLVDSISKLLLRNFNYLKGAAPGSIASSSFHDFPQVSVLLTTNSEAKMLLAGMTALS
jgi:hypothetical protein